MANRKVPEFDGRHTHDVAGDAEGSEGKSNQSYDQFTLLCNYLVNNVKVVGKPSRVADLVLNEVLEQVSREHEGSEPSKHSACEHDWYREKESIELGVKNLGIGVAKHHNGVRDWNRKNDAESQNIDRVANRLVRVHLDPVNELVEHFDHQLEIENA